MSDEATWPSEVLAYLEQHRALFEAWELPRISTAAASVSVAEYDDAIRGLRIILSKHTLHGYHCTRLTDAEVARILENGMSLPNGAMLEERIQEAQAAGLVEPHIADRLRRENQADAANRADKIWFCFFAPHVAGQRGIERLLRSWGGEALYGLHEDDPVTGAILRSIGKPSLIEADVPISSLHARSFLDDKIARQFLINRGLETHDPTEHEDRAIHPIPAQYTRRIIQFPEPDFVSLTRCDTWKPPLT